MTSNLEGNNGIKVVRARTIGRSPAELYTFWRRLENLALVVRHPITITARSPSEYHWIVSAPLGHDPVEWDSIIINDEPDNLIAWRSKEGSEVANAGSVRFTPAPGRQGTEVTVALEYDPPGGKIAGWIAKLSKDEPGHQVADTLRRMQALLETGEIPTIDGQSVGEPQRSNRNKEKKP